MELLSFDSATIERQCSEMMVGLLHQTQEKNATKKLVVALSGGNSPKGLLTRLSQDISPSLAKSIVLVQVDDRMVAPTHSDSNQKMIRQYCKDLLAKGAKFLAIPVESKDAAEQYQNTMTSLLDTHEEYIPCLALMGMGGDGHAASIFPRSDEHLSPSSSLYVFNSKEKYNGYVRISLSYAALYTFEHTLFYIPGEDKKEIIRTVIDATNIEKHKYLYPATKLMYEHKHCIFCSTVSV